MNADFLVFVGIDWADAEHAVCLFAGEQRERSVLPQEAGALDEWAQSLQARFPGQRIAVCLEASRGPLVYALLKYEFLVLFPLNPKQLASYRSAFRPSGGKNDPGDAELLARFLREHHLHLRAWQPDDVLTRSLRLLGESRRSWVEQRTAAGNRLLQALKEAYPLALQFLGKYVHGQRFLELLVKFPSQRELQRAPPRLLVQWLNKLRRVADDPPSTPAGDPRVQALRQVPPLVTDEAVLRANRLAVLHLAKQLQQFNRTIDEYDEQLRELTAQHPDAELFRSFPGAGEALTPRLIAAFGSQRERYASAADVQQLSGIAPVQLQSGKLCVVKKRRACPSFLRQTFHEQARCSLISCRWAQAYCAMLRARGVGFHAAVRSLAYKWQRIMFRCWQTGQHYDEGRYLAQLRRKQSPLLQFLKTNSATET
jgi:transposase